VNLDINPECPLFGRKNKPDIVADCRDLPGPLNGRRFDTLVLGELLEHFPVEDVPDVLRKAKACLKPGGRIVITVPDDHRHPNDQHSHGDGTELYTEGVHACHTHRVTKEIIEGWMVDSGLHAEVLYGLDYTHFTGHGVVAVSKENQDDSN
jgi:2-polyprenyl-3-methyl-5-hydroxy-6-metoxy-1,4-benzoquinol methylase